jgi:hypothetical protein
MKTAGGLIRFVQFVHGGQWYNPFTITHITPQHGPANECCFIDVIGVNDSIRVNFPVQVVVAMVQAAMSGLPEGQP